jgi:hypothetical protein
METVFPEVTPLTRMIGVLTEPGLEAGVMRVSPVGVVGALTKVNLPERVAVWLCESVNVMVDSPADAVLVIQVRVVEETTVGEAHTLLPKVIE